MTLQVMRNRRVQSITVSPAATNDRKIPWQIGVRFKMPVQMVSLRLRRAMEESVRLNQESALMTFQFLAGILKRRVSPKALSGPIGIASAMREAATTDSRSYLFLMASVSLEIAIFNLLPIPGLDGGVLLMLIIETLLRRKLSPQVNQMIFALGRVFLITIIVLVIYNDLSNILSRSGVVSLRGG
jgi:regulator of sigma E protease